MNFPALLTASAMLLSPVGAVAADEAVRTEQPQAKDAEQSSQLDRYTALIKQMQQRLKAEGFDPGPIDGDSGGRTQAALAQFQLSRSLPAGGQLDDKTLAELGVERDTQASAGASAESSTRARPDLPADAQPAGAPGAGERPARPDSASNARVGGWCDALTGEKKEQCLRDERRKPDRTARDPGTRGSCDALIGPEKVRCLHQGGSIEVDAKPSTGGTAGDAARNQ